MTLPGDLQKRVSVGGLRGPSKSIRSPNGSDKQQKPLMGGAARAVMPGGAVVQHEQPASRRLQSPGALRIAPARHGNKGPYFASCAVAMDVFPVLFQTHRIVPSALSDAAMEGFSVLFQTHCASRPSQFVFLWAIMTEGHAGNIP